MAEWLQDNLFHVIKTTLGFGTCIYDVGSDLFMGATYISCGTTTSPVNSSSCPEPDVYWGSITLGLTQLRGYYSKRISQPTSRWFEEGASG